MHGGALGLWLLFVLNAKFEGKRGRSVSSSWGRDGGRRDLRVWEFRRAALHAKVKAFSVEGPIWTTGYEYMLDSS